MNSNRAIAILACLATLAPAPLLRGDAPDLSGEASRTALPGRGIVVLDAGHGGADFGARGLSGLREKDLVLKASRHIGRALEDRGIEVVYTRTKDEFVSLPERTSIANQSRADLFLSIHANSAPDPEAQGFETYFLSLDASDEEAMRVAMSENDVYRQEGTTDDGADIVGSIFGDLIRTQHLRGSSRAAAAIQRRLARLPGGSRGVKQAPFVVLTGVNMPAALIEIGFLTHAEEERRLQRTPRQKAIANAIADAVVETLGSTHPVAEPPAHDAPASVEAGE